MMLTRSYALPYIHALSFDIPHGTLRVHGPIDVDFPSAGGVTHETRHSEEEGSVKATGRKLLRVQGATRGGRACRYLCVAGTQTCRARD